MCRKIAGKTFSSDLRKPCLKTGKSLSAPTKLILFKRKITYYITKTRWEVFTYKGIKLDKQYETLEPEDDSEKETSLFGHLASKVFIFIMALILLVVALIVIMLLFKGAKMQALVTNLAVLKGVKALTEGIKIGTNYEYWIIIAWLSLILLSVMFLIIEKVHKMPIL